MPDDTAEGNRMVPDDAAGGNRTIPDDAAEEGSREALEARLAVLRGEIAEVTDRLIGLMGERRTLTLEIGQTKEALGLPVLDPAREAEVVRHAAARARDMGVDEEMTREVIWRIMASAREAQQGVREFPPRPEQDEGQEPG